MMFCAVMASAQTDLAGRVYYNANIMEPLMAEAVKDLDKKMAEERQKAVTDFEEENGRKPTEKDLEDIDHKLKEARAIAEAMKKGLSTAVTITFKDASRLVMKFDMKFSDDALKAVGMGWLKRKAIKAALAVAPKSQKGTYCVQGNAVIIENGEDKDTMMLSDDGRFLSGMMDEKTPFKLSRTK
jgi:hypothetical protein